MKKEVIVHSVGRRIAVPLAIAGVTLGGAAVAVGAEGQTNTGTTDSATEQHVQELKDAGAMKYKLVVPGLSKAEEPPTPTPTPIRPTPTPDNRQSVEGLSIEGANIVVSLINKIRQEAGASPLSIDQKVTKAAEKYAQLVFEKGDFKNATDALHYLDADPNQRAAREGYIGPVVEDLGWSVGIAEREGWTAAVVQAWMDSPGHRGVILDPKTPKNIGVGCFVSDVPANRLYGRTGDELITLAVCIADFAINPAPPPPGR